MNSRKKNPKRPNRSCLSLLLLGKVYFLYPGGNISECPDLWAPKILTQMKYL